MTRISAFSLVAILLFIAMPVLQLLITGDFPGSSEFYGMPEDHEFVNFLFTLRK